MNTCTPHFVRCIKPNLDKAPDLFKLDLVTKQLRYTGMLETTRIRKEGYSHRPNFKDFIQRYQMIAFGLNSKPPMDASSCKAILSRTNCTGWQVGKTKVFLRYFHIPELHEALKPYPTAAERIQTAARCFVARKKFQEALELQKKQVEEVSSFLVHCHKRIDIKYEEQKVLCEEDVLRPPDFFERKKKSTRSIRNPTHKKMQKKADKKGVSRAQSVKWFKEVEMAKGAGQVGGDSAGEQNNSFEAWFHGIISRKDAEKLLSTKNPGAFLVRVAESRFGYSLSHKVTEEGRVRHYMVDVTPEGEFFFFFFMLYSKNW